MTIPNIITILRLLLVPVIVVMISSGAWLGAFLLFVAAGASDGIDGYIARHYDMRSELGAYLDAFADKALLISIYIALAISSVMPEWIVILVVSRDIVILMAIIISWLMSRPVDIHPLKVSKLNTVAQIVLAALVLAERSMLGADLGKNVIIAVPWVIHLAMISVVTLTAVSAGAYLVLWLRHMGE